MHHQDSNGGIFLSDREMNLNQYLPVEGFIKKLTKSLVGSASATEIKLLEDSVFLELINTQFSFIEKSKEIAKDYFETFEFTGARNILFSMIDIGEEILFVGFEMKSKSGFVEGKEDMNGLQNTLNYSAGILSDRFSGVGQAFCLYLTSGNLKVKTKTLSMFEDFVLGERIANAKDSFITVDNIVTEMSIGREDNKTLNRIKAKRIILDMDAQDEEGGEYSLFADEIIKGVFEDLEEEELLNIGQTLQDKGVHNPIPLKNIQNNAVVKKHKIVTETGIEILLPIDSLAVEELIEVDEKTGTILIRNTGKIL